MCSGDLLCDQGGVLASQRGFGNPAVTRKPCREVWLAIPGEGLCRAERRYRLGLGP